MEEDRNILEARAANVDNTDAQLVDAYPQYLLKENRYQNFLHITFDKYHTFGEEQIATHRIQITLDTVDLGGLKPTGRLISLAERSMTAQDVDIAHIADFGNVSGVSGIYDLRITV